VGVVKFNLEGVNILRIFLWWFDERMFGFFFFYFLGLGKLDGWVGLPTLPLFIIHKIVDYEKYSGTVRTVPFGTMPFIKNAFAFSMKSICALFCGMHWQNKVLPYWVF
jgi:hypothetical protein